jgi:hypothetical protein
MDLGGVGWTATAPGEPWQARIGAADGTVVGAGVVVGAGRVLTGARVVESAQRRLAPADRAAVTVELVGRSEAPWPATVVPGGWFPAGEDGSADIAVLEISSPPGAAPRAPLWRLAATQGRPVRLFGYPPGAEHDGRWARAVLAGPVEGSEWVRLDGDGDLIDGGAGFGGAAVLDEATGLPIGLVVAGAAGDGEPHPWMLPVESILRYLRRARGVRGEAAVDESLVTDELVMAGEREVEAARPLVGWLAGRGRRPVRLVAVGAPDPGPTAGPDVAVPRSVLCRLVVLADRELRPPAANAALLDAPPRTVPPVGSVDLAIDVSGRAIDEVAQRLANRFGLRADEAAALADELGERVAGATVVIDGVDDAAEPEALIEELLVPLVDRGVRLLLAFRRPWSPAWELAQARWPDHDLDEDDPAVVADRLDALAGRVTDLAGREDALLRRRASVALRIADVPALPTRALSLRRRVARAPAPHRRAGGRPGGPAARRARRRPRRAARAAG